MSLIQLENVCKAFGAVPILTDISWNVDRGDRTGLVGRNGCGKTTLFHILTGELRPDSGSAHRARTARLGYLAQDVTFEPGHTVHDAVLEGFGEVLSLRDQLREIEARMSAGDHAQATLDAYSRVHGRYEHLDGYSLEARAEAILHGLGFAEADTGLPVDVLSGGQRNRLGLARLLASQPDVLLLDEPTNHLDLRGIEWLERFLSDYPGTFIVISHDRYFLDCTVRDIVDLEHQRIRRYRGGYTAYASQKALLIEQQQKTWDAQQAHISRTEEYIRRNIAGQKTRQAKSRRKALAKMDRIDRPLDQKDVSLTFSTAPRGGDRVFQVESISKAYDGKVLFENLDFIAWRGDRIGVVGPNGTGKSTLIKVLTGRIAPDKGRVSLGRGTEVGYYDQSRIDINPDRTVLQEVWSVTPDATVTEIRTFLGAFLFSGDEVEMKVGGLSGGEQSRVALAKLVRTPVNLLVLDEPTNHLDIPSRIVLERALRDYPGTIVTVSHDRYFLNDIITRLIVLEEGRWRVVDGDYETLSTLWSKPAPLASPAAPAERPAEPVSDGSARRQARPERKAGRDAEKRKRRAAELERQIAEMEAEGERLDREMAREDLATDWAKLKALSEERERIRSAVEEKFAEWEAMEADLRGMEA